MLVIILELFAIDSSRYLLVQNQQTPTPKHQLSVWNLFKVNH